jgi:sulfoxide reductase catalytic subunit YedY
MSPYASNRESLPKNSIHDEEPDVKFRCLLTGKTTLQARNLIIRLRNLSGLHKVSRRELTWFILSIDELCRINSLPVTAVFSFHTPAHSLEEVVMLIKHKDPNLPRSSEITPEKDYFNRRRFIKSIGFAGAAAALVACNPVGNPSKPTPVGVDVTKRDEFGDISTPYDYVSHYNNYYEFSTDKEAVSALSSDFTTSPWQVEVGGLVNKPRTFGLEDILKDFEQEERIYRLRCVEGWSMVIPWEGFSLSEILKQVEPTSDAKYVYFETVFRPEEMPGQKLNYYPWPYTEGLRIDEAMNPLASIVTGVYGQALLPANGAPIRLVVPWKYGFKSIKSIIKINLTDKQPDTLWNLIAPNEYGFYSNVNPKRPHPRWSQDSERRIGEVSRRDTLMFNGYENQVADLYAGMDLLKDY